MAHHDNRNAEACDHLLKERERLHVEVVGRLIKDEEIAGLQENLGEEQSVLLSPGERAHRRHRAPRLKKEVAQVAYNRLLLPSDLNLGAPGRNIVPDGEVLLKLVAVLVKVGNLKPGAGLNRAGIRRELAEEHLYESGLSGAVGSQDRDLVSPQHAEGEILYEALSAEALRDILALEDDLPRELSLSDAEPHLAHALPSLGELAAHLLELLHPAGVPRKAGLDALPDPDLLLGEPPVKVGVRYILLPELLLLHGAVF